ncbi:MAG: hypothetical protein H8E83_00705, partial [Planctomycetes bacterium]|nr:hypothetical protein [Planctomycetota bacterium]
MLKQILLTSISVMAATASADFEIGPVPSDAPAGLDVFTKHVDVLGLHVFAKSNVSDS